MDEADHGETSEPESLNDPAFQKAVFKQAYEQTCLQLDAAETGDDMRTLGRINKGRNGAITGITSDFAESEGAECAAGCSCCCHQMVLCTPFEIFDIARHILDSKSPAEISAIKDRLARHAPLPLDEESRRGPGKPCALLEDHRCSVYENRPSLCRTMLSTSRAACETSLNAAEPSVPFIAGPVIVTFLMQLGIDYALMTRRRVSTEKVEMSRALLIALENFEAALAAWRGGKEAFPDCHPAQGSGPSNAGLAEMAAQRFSVD